MSTWLHGSTEVAINDFIIYQVKPRNTNLYRICIICIFFFLFDKTSYIFYEFKDQIHGFESLKF